MLRSHLKLMKGKCDKNWELKKKFSQKQKCVITECDSKSWAETVKSF